MTNYPMTNNPKEYICQVKNTLGHIKIKKLK
jgi:hypothetical protein